MTPAIFQQLVETLRREPATLGRLHALARDAGSNWSIDQLHLMLACMDGIAIDAAGDDAQVRLGQPAPHDELAEAVAEVIHSQGDRPLPATQVMSLLPKRFTTSEAQLKKLARESGELKLVGPGLIGLSH